MSSRHENPIPRLAHALLDHLALYEPDTPGHARVAEMIDDHAAIAQYVERQEQNIATMAEESNEREREVTRLQREKADVVEALESMLRMNAARLDSITAERRAQQALYHRLVGPIRPMSVIAADDRQAVQA
jgi:hypothetical protein